MINKTANTIAVRFPFAICSLSSLRMLVSLNSCHKSLSSLIVSLVGSVKLSHSYP